MTFDAERVIAKGIRNDFWCRMPTFCASGTLMRLTKPPNRVRCAYAETTGYRRTMGGSRTALAEAVTQTKGRTPSHRRPSGAHGHPVRAQKRHTLGDAAPRDGVRLRHDLLLAAPEGVARSGRIWDRPQDDARPSRRGRRDRLGACVPRLGERAGPRGAKKTGPNPTDIRGNRAPSAFVVVDRRGVPLAVIHTAANVHDSKALRKR